MQEAYEWVKKIIESCTSVFHLGAAKRLVDYYGEMYGKGELYESLKAEVIAQTVSINL